MESHTAAVYMFVIVFVFLHLYLYLYLNLAVDSSEGRDQCAHTEALQLCSLLPFLPTPTTLLAPTIATSVGKLFSETNLATVAQFFSAKKGISHLLVASCSWTLKSVKSIQIRKLIETGKEGKTYIYSESTDRYFCRHCVEIPKIVTMPPNLRPFFKPD